MFCLGDEIPEELNDKGKMDDALDLAIDLCGLSNDPRVEKAILAIEIAQAFYERWCEE